MRWIAWDFVRSMMGRAETAPTNETTTSSTPPSANSATVGAGSALSAEAVGTYEISICNGDGTPVEQESFDCDLYDGPHFHIDGRCLGETSSRS